MEILPQVIEQLLPYGKLILAFYVLGGIVTIGVSVAVFAIIIRRHREMDRRFNYGRRL